MLLTGVQFVLLVVYAALPVGFLAHALVVRFRQGRSMPLFSFVLSAMTAIIVGSGLLMLNRLLMGGPIDTDDGLRLIYLALAAILLLRVIDRVLLRAWFHLARVRLDAAGHPVAGARLRAALVLLGQRLVMLGVIISYGMGLLLTCRPKVLREGDPLGRYRLSGSVAQFTTRDGLLLTGWWITAAEVRRGTDAEVASKWGKRTVLLCHGIGSSKEELLPLARLLSESGFNVLLFDFRGHGQSGGSFISYGDRERLDVLAAARWVKANHLEEAQRVYGIGINTGAAALIGAAADPTHGREIDGLVLYEPFARFGTLAASVADETLPAPLAWLTKRISLPIASAHAGTNLVSFSPADLAADVWPRPVLLVHGCGMTFIPVGQEMDLYNKISYPKEQYWPGEGYTSSRSRLGRARNDTDMLTEMFRQWLGISNPITEDYGVRDATLRFLWDAQPMPVI